MKNQQDGDWKEWSRHVLIEIQRLSDRQERMNDTLTENTKQLEVHIEGVRLAREQNALLKGETAERFKDLETSLEPIKDQVKFVNTSLTFWSKTIGVVVVFPACIYYIISIYFKLKG